MRPYFQKLQIQITQKKRERLKQENLDHPDKQGPFSRGDPEEKDDDGDDRDDDDEENDSKPPSIEGISTPTLPMGQAMTTDHQLLRLPTMTQQT